MHIPVIKTDPKRPHHYLIGVRINDSIWSEDMGKLKLSYGPIYYSNNDVDNLKNAILLANDKLLHTKIKDSLDIFKCRKISAEISAMKMAIVMNKGSLHHFSMEEKLSDASEWFEIFVDSANTSQSTKQLLMEARR